MPAAAAPPSAFFRHVMWQDGMWQQGKKRQTAVKVSLWFEHITDCQADVLLRNNEKKGGWTKLGARAARRSLKILPHAFLQSVRVYLSGHCSIYITIRPSGLCTNTHSLRSHALQRRNSWECRLTLLVTYACISAVRCPISASFQSAKVVKFNHFPLRKKDIINTWS